MSELDVAKEKIAYLKVWLGILLVADLSTFGWFVEPRHRYYLAAVGGHRGRARLDPWHSPAPSAD
jgi:hypothetical protein